MNLKKLLIIALASACGIASGSMPSRAAENIVLAPGLSFTSDIGTVFPIVGQKMDDYAIDVSKPTLIFFGATGDLNTNRQAKRLVELYKKEHGKTKFVIVNVDNTTNDVGRQLIRKYYPGYIPAQLLLDRDGKVIWSQIGEVSRRRLGAQINTAM